MSAASDGQTTTLNKKKSEVLLITNAEHHAKRESVESKLSNDDLQTKVSQLQEQNTILQMNNRELMEQLARVKRQHGRFREFVCEVLRAHQDVLLCVLEIDDFTWPSHSVSHRDIAYH